MSLGRLTDPWYEATFIGGATPERGYKHLPSIEGAQGLFCWCPCSFGKNDRAHGCIIPFANPRNAPVPDHNFGIRARDGVTKTRWQMSGESLSDLTLSPSIDVGEPSCWHGYIKNGEVT